MGVWHPRWNAGVVHYADYAELPGKKIWSWGVDPDGLDWRRALSDNDSAYVEIQAGLYRNQETYAFLAPQSEIRFNEFWMPAREIGGISRANLEGIVFLRRENGRLRVGLNVNHTVPGARIRVLDGDRPLLDVRQDLDPAHTLVRNLEAPPDRKCSFELSDAHGRVLLAHTEDTYDWTPASEIHAGPQPEIRRADDPLELGQDQELNGRLLTAMETYRRALERAPDNFELNKAAGRLAVTLKDYSSALAMLGRAQERVSNDAEVQYYLGHAYMGAGDDRHARAEWELAQLQPGLRAAARLQLGYLEAREGRPEKALEWIRAAMSDVPSVRIRAIEVVVLRVLGRTDEAAKSLDAALAEDPTNSFLRYEKAKLGTADEDLWRHLAADPERVLEMSVDYMQLGFYREALDLLSRRYPQIDPQEAEPGTALPQDYPLVAYYRGFCREKLGQDGTPDHRAASGMSTRYVFPYRPTDLAVLNRAVERNPSDATAHFLLGDIYLSGGMTDPAILEWRSALRLNPRIPVLHRNLGRTLLALKRDDQGALEVFRQGLTADPGNVEIYQGLTQTMAILERPPAERVAVLEQYPDRASMPTPLVLDLALSYAEADRFDDAERMFRNRYFEREEGGANVRQVYLETRMLQALALAVAGRGEEARPIEAAFSTPVADLDFTRDGMEVFLNSPRFQYYEGMLDQRLADEAGARRHWVAAAGGNGIFAALSARKLDDAGWKARAEQMSSLGSSVDRGIALSTLGRLDEAREMLAGALRMPDHNLSHYFARRALAEFAGR